MDTPEVVTQSEWLEARKAPKRLLDAASLRN